MGQQDRAYGGTSRRPGHANRIGVSPVLGPFGCWAGPVPQLLRIRRIECQVMDLFITDSSGLRGRALRESQQHTRHIPSLCLSPHILSRKNTLPPKHIPNKFRACRCEWRLARQAGGDLKTDSGGARAAADRESSRDTEDTGQWGATVDDHRGRAQMQQMLGCVLEAGPVSD